MSSDKVQQEEKMNSGLSIAQRDILQERLRELPDTMPPRAVWQRIEEQARAEGLIGTPTLAGTTRWLVGAGLAAAVALMVLRLPVQPPESAENEVFSTEPPLTDVASNNGLNVLNALMVESRQLENNLRSLPEQPQLVRAGTAATIVRLEDTIARIDQDLNNPALKLSDDDKELYWRERVRLMNSLVQLRAAQVRRKSF